MPAAATWTEVPSHRIEAPEGVDGVLAVGGGSSIDTAKAASAATGLPLVSVPTTYSGAEWTPTYGIRNPGKRMVGGGGGALPTGIVYEPELTLGLPRPASGGTAMNALAHCVEALYPADLGSRARARRRSSSGCRTCSTTSTISTRERICSKAPASLGRPCAPRSSARARDGAGDRWAVRASARGAQRDLPPGGDALQRGETAPGILDVVSIETARAARAARRLHAASGPRRAGGGSRRARGRGRGAPGGESESATG